jgi:hypothetical protein
MFRYVFVLVAVLGALALRYMDLRSESFFFGLFLPGAYLLAVLFCVSAGLGWFLWYSGGTPLPPPWDSSHGSSDHHSSSGDSMPGDFGGDAGS